MINFFNLNILISCVHLPAAQDFVRRVCDQNRERQEKWYEREIERLKKQLSAIMERENIDLETIFQIGAITTLKDEIRLSMESILKEMNSLENFKNSFSVIIDSVVDFQELDCEYLKQLFQLDP